MREREGGYGILLSPPFRIHSFEDDIKEIGIGGTCSTYSEEINSYNLSVKLSHVFSNTATRSARNKLVFSLVQSHQTSISVDGVSHQHVNLHT